MACILLVLSLKKSNLYIINIMKKYNFVYYLTILFFSLQSILGLTTGFGAEFPSTAQKNTRSIGDLFIPESYGHIKQPASNNYQNQRPLVILIKDAHCHYEAQKNISKILDLVNRNYQIELIGLEGAAGTVDPNVISSSADAQQRKKVADKYLRLGWLTAIEALAIERGKDYGFTIRGIEDLRLYLQNLISFRDVYRDNTQADKFLEKSTEIIIPLKKLLYPKNVLIFDDNVTNYKNNNLPFSAFIEYLSGSYSSYIPKYRNVSLALKAILLEKTTDFNKLEKERALLIEKCEETLPADELKQLVKNSLEYKLDEISSLDYYKFLETLLPAFPASPSFTNLKNYIKILQFHSGIDPDGLFIDIDNLIEEIYTTILVEKDLLDLHNIDTAVFLLNKLKKLEISREELNQYDKSAFTPAKIAAFLGKQSKKHNLLPVPKIFNGQQILQTEDFYNRTRVFYHYALAREQSIVDKLISQLEANDTDRAALIVGGFHALGVEKLLTEKGLEVITITPTITKNDPSSRKAYLERMLDNTFSPDKLLNTLSLAHLAPDVITDSSWQSIRRGILELISDEMTGAATVAKLREADSLESARAVLDDNDIKFILDFLKEKDITSSDSRHRFFALLLDTTQAVAGSQERINQIDSVYDSLDIHHQLASRRSTIRNALIATALAHGFEKAADLQDIRITIVDTKEFPLAINDKTITISRSLLEGADDALFAKALEYGFNALLGEDNLIVLLDIYESLIASISQDPGQAILLASLEEKYRALLKRSLADYAGEINKLDQEITAGITQIRQLEAQENLMKIQKEIIILAKELAEIDAKLNSINRKIGIAKTEELLNERKRLLEARNQIKGKLGNAKHIRNKIIQQTLPSYRKLNYDPTEDKETPLTERETKIGRLQYLSQQYEELVQKARRQLPGFTDTRSDFMIVVPSFNRPQDLDNLLASIERELESFHYGKNRRIHIVILNDSHIYKQEHNDTYLDIYNTFAGKLAKWEGQVTVSYYDQKRQHGIIKNLREATEGEENGPVDLGYFVNETSAFHAKGYGGIRNMMQIIAAIETREQGLDENNLLVLHTDDDMKLSNPLRRTSQLKAETEGYAGFDEVHIYNFFGQTSRVFAEDEELHIFAGGVTIQDASIANQPDRAYIYYFDSVSNTSGGKAFWTEMDHKQLPGGNYTTRATLELRIIPFIPRHFRGEDLLLGRMTDARGYSAISQAHYQSELRDMEANLKNAFVGQILRLLVNQLFTRAEKQSDGWDSFLGLISNIVAIPDIAGFVSANIADEDIVERSLRLYSRLFDVSSFNTKLVKEIISYNKEKDILDLLEGTTNKDKALKMLQSTISGSSILELLSSAKNTEAKEYKEALALIAEYLSAWEDDLESAGIYDDTPGGLNHKHSIVGRLKGLLKSGRVPAWRILQGLESFMSTRVSLELDPSSSKLIKEYLSQWGDELSYAELSGNHIVRIRHELQEQLDSGASVAQIQATLTKITSAKMQYLRTVMMETYTKLQSVMTRLEGEIKHWQRWQEIIAGAELASGQPLDIRTLAPPLKQEQTPTLPASENIGKDLAFEIIGNSIVIRAPDGTVISEGLEAREPAAEEFDAARREKILETARGIQAGENAEFMRVLERMLAEGKIRLFTGDNSSRAAGAFGHMREGVLYLDEALLDNDMAIIHEALHAFLISMSAADLSAAIDALPAGTRDKIHQKAAPYAGTADHAAYLRHYYARYYLQNDQNGRYRGKANERLTYDIKLNCVAALLGMDVHELERILSKKGATKTTLEYRIKLLNLLKKDGRVTTSELQLITSNADKVGKVMALINIGVADKMQERMSRIQEILAMELAMKEIEEQKAPSLFQRIKDYLLALVELISHLAGKVNTAPGPYYLDRYGNGGQPVFDANNVIDSLETGENLDIEGLPQLMETLGRNHLLLEPGKAQQLLQALAGYQKAGELLDTAAPAARTAQWSEDVPLIVEAQHLVGEVKDNGDGTYSVAPLGSSAIGILRQAAEKGQLRILYNAANKGKDGQTEMEKEAVKMFLAAHGITAVSFASAYPADIIEESLYAVSMLTETTASGLQGLSAKHRIITGKSGESDLLLMSRMAVILGTHADLTAEKGILEDKFTQLYTAYYQGQLAGEKIDEYIAAAMQAIIAGKPFIIQLPEIVPFIKPYYNALQYTRELVAASA